MHGPVRQTRCRKLATAVGSGLGCGLLKGWRRKEKKVLFSGCGVVVRIPVLGSRIERVGFEFELDSRRLKWGELAAEEDDPLTVEVWATAPPET